MSDIWSLIKQGKEKLGKQEKHMEDVDNDDIVMLDAPIKPKIDEEEKEINTNTDSETDLPLWLSNTDLYNIRKLSGHPSLQLHEELIRLVNWIEPTNLDKFLRQTVFEDVQKVITKELPNSTVYPFGSYLTNLSLPNSDLDIMVECNEDCNYLKLVDKIIRKSGFATRIVCIKHARVPLVKFVHKFTGISVDISFNQDSSLLTSAYVIRQLDRYPHLRCMVLILKYMLAQRELNDTYSGGIGSFMITLLCISCEQWCIREGTEKGNLGNHLLQFFYYYGMLLNYDKLVLRLRNDGGYVDKVTKDWLQDNKEFYLSVENPIDPTLDVGKSSFNIKVIRFRSFCSHALCKLMYNISEIKTINTSPTGYLLNGLIRIDKRYPKDIRSTEFFKKWSQEGVEVPDAEAIRLKLVHRHLEAVKRCSEDELKRVYEQDFERVIHGEVKIEKGRQKFSQKRNFNERIGNNKKYRRF